MKTAKKFIHLIHESTNIGFVFWFLTGVLITIICYQPFNQPILFDRAYLLHMSQVVARGESLYEATTFGYTPLSTLLVGAFMKAGALFSLDTIESARVIGLLLYGSLCGSFFLLAKSLFERAWPTIVACTFFCGLGYIQLVSSLNAEPKLWVMLLSILGIYFYNKRNWLIIGLLFSFAVMCWHVAVVSLFACALMLPWKSKSFLRSFFRLSIGIFLGVTPVLLYLAITNSWMEFWNQAVLRKLIVEAATAGESPLQWIREGIYPFFILEPLHFIFAFCGFLFAIYTIIKRKTQNYINNNLLRFILIYTTVWTLFNTFDFQTCVDLFPIVPTIVIFATYFIITVVGTIKRPWLVYLSGVILICYNFFDAFLYKTPYSYQDQLTTINYIKDKYDDPFVIGFEEYYTILEKPMPTKFMRFAHYEDHMIEDPNNGFKPILKQVKSKRFNVIIEFDKNKRKRSKQSSAIFKHFPDRDKRVFKRSKSASYLIHELSNNSPIDSLKIIAQTIPYINSFYTKEHYNIFKIE